MTAPDATRNPLVALAAFMLIGLGGLVLVAGAVTSGGRLLVVGAGALLALGGFVLLAASRTSAPDEDVDA